MKKLIAWTSGLTLGVFTISSMALSPAFGTFNDYTGFDFYYSSIELLAEKGIVEGYSDGSYGYNDEINRAEFMKILIETRDKGQNVKEYKAYEDENCFEDVEAGKWYTGYVCYGADKGWVEGYSDGKFRPGESINFVEAIKIAVNVLGVPELVGRMADNDPWYAEYVITAADHELIPMTIDNFAQEITRSEMADIIARKMKSDEGEIEDFLGSKAGYRVTYDDLRTGVNRYEQWLDDGYGNYDDFYDQVPEDLSIDTILPNLNTLTFYLSGTDLASGELYHVECLELGKAQAFAKSLDTKAAAPVLTGLKEGTNYNCWAAVKRSNGGLVDRTADYTVATVDKAHKLQIDSYSSTPEEIFIKLKSFTLSEGEQYFVECLEMGGTYSVSKLSTSTNFTLAVKSDATYTCYGAISPKNGLNKYFSDPVSIEVGESKLIVDEFSVFSSYVRFSVEPVNLHSGEYFYAQCLKGGNLVPNGSPSDQGTDVDFWVEGLAANTEYECTVEIRGSKDPDYQPSKPLGFKTKSNSEQVQINTAFVEVDGFGDQFITLGTETLLASGDTFVYRCWNQSGIEAVIEVTTSQRVDLDVVGFGEIYTCSISVGNELSSKHGSEHIWLKTPTD